MPNIKTKIINSKGIKTIDKKTIEMQKMKNNIVNIKEKAEEINNDDENNVDYGSNKITKTSGYTASRVINQLNNYGKKSFVETKNNVIKIKNYKNKRMNKKLKSNKIKTSKEVIRKSQKIAKENMKRSKRILQYTKELTKKTIIGIKQTIKVIISSVKGIIAGTKALISAIAAGGWIAVVIIVVICFIGLLCSSTFGIFLSSENNNKNSMTMKQVVSECNQDFYNKLQEIQNANPHDDYVLDGNMTDWKDVLIVYAIKETNGNNKQEVITVDENKKSVIKQIFWDMNELSSEVKDEIVTEQGINTDEIPRQVQKKVLHIKINNKTIEQMKILYNFNSEQNRQLLELTDSRYSSLWNNVIYGSNNSGDYLSWKQYGQSWSNKRIGNTNSTLGQIGCLITSISILIEKSGCNTAIKPFNPGTFLDALNKNNAFDESGNLKFSGVTKAVPNFKYAGNINLRGKTKEEKLSIIKQYYNQGYYLAVEVKGATPGNQHWVALTEINDNNITIVDPGSNATNLWSYYEWNKTSQFNYYKII